MDEQMIEPCPFCGSEAYVWRKSSGLIGECWPRVRCYKCGATGQCSDVLNEGGPAIAAWNHRAAHSVMAGKVAELIEALHEARLQLEYLDGKFAPTGTTAGVLARIDAALALRSHAQQP